MKKLTIVKLTIVKLKMHKHNYIEENHHLRCECGKTILKLNNKYIINSKNNKQMIEGLKLGKRNDGRDYSVREDRRRYFFPGEWLSFIRQVNNKQHKFLFITLLFTGARIMEVLNLKYEDIDIKRDSIIFKTTKQRKTKSQSNVLGKKRNFFVPSNFIKEYKSFIRKRKMNKEDYIFLDNSKLPENYYLLSNKEKKKYYFSKQVSYGALFKRKMKSAEIDDWWNFSLHNIRKTYGNWMRTFNIDKSELCYRMGHDLDTYMLHYGSSLIFTENERRQIEKIFGEVK